MRTRRLSALIATPAPRGARTGNRVTALRWARALRVLGHRVAVVDAFDGRPCDLLIALHARHSAESVFRWARERPGAPVIVALTGTDLYDDIHHDERAQRALHLASRLVVLQPLGIAQFTDGALRARTRSILQSARAPGGVIAPTTDRFRFCALGHLREVKDPFCAAAATRELPSDSRVEIVHVGAALDDAMRQRALRESAANPRWQWLGVRPRADALRILAGSRGLVLTSRSEGGANAVIEAIACGVPVVCTRIDGCVGILGDAYPGYFRVGDASALAMLLRRVETEPAFGAALTQACVALQPVVAPAREVAQWHDLLAELFPAAS